MITGSSRSRPPRGVTSRPRARDRPPRREGLYHGEQPPGYPDAVFWGVLPACRVDGVGVCGPGARAALVLLVEVPDPLWMLKDRLVEGVFDVAVGEDGTQRAVSDEQVALELTPQIQPIPETQQTINLPLANTYRPWRGERGKRKRWPVMPNASHLLEAPPR